MYLDPRRRYKAGAGAMAGGYSLES